MRSIQEIAKNKHWMTLLSRLKSVLPVESLIVITEIWEKYHQLGNETLQNIIAV